MSRNCWTNGKQCRPWSDATFCGVWSGSSLFAKACLYENFRLNKVFNIYITRSDCANFTRLFAYIYCCFLGLKLWLDYKINQLYRFSSLILKKYPAINQFLKFQYLTAILLCHVFIFNLPVQKMSYNALKLRNTGSLSLNLFRFETNSRADFPKLEKAVIFDLLQSVLCLKPAGSLTSTGL